LGRETTTGSRRQAIDRGLSAPPRRGTPIIRHDAVCRRTRPQLSAAWPRVSRRKPSAPTEAKREITPDPAGSQGYRLEPTSQHCKQPKITFADPKNGKMGNFSNVSFQPNDTGTR